MRSGLGRLRKHTVTLHLKTETSFRGVLVDAYRDVLVLDKPVLLSEKEELDEPLGGQAVFPRENIDYFTIEKSAWQR